MRDCVWTHAVFIVWNLLEDTAQLQPWPRSLAYCQEVKGVHVGLNLCSKTVSWADVLFAYSCTATITRGWVRVLRRNAATMGFKYIIEEVPPSKTSWWPQRTKILWWRRVGSSTVINVAEWSVMRNILESPQEPLVRGSKNTRRSLLHIWPL